MEENDYTCGYCGQALRHDGECPNCRSVAFGDVPLAAGGATFDASGQLAGTQLNFGLCPCKYCETERMS
jgi:hypothetical protein